METIEVLRGNLQGRQLRIKEGMTLVQGQISSVAIEENIGFITISFRWVAIKKPLRAWEASHKGHYPAFLMMDKISPEVKEKSDGQIKFFYYDTPYIILPINHKTKINPYEIPRMPQGKLK